MAVSFWRSKYLFSPPVLGRASGWPHQRGSRSRLRILKFNMRHRQFSNYYAFRTFMGSNNFCGSFYDFLRVWRLFECQSRTPNLSVDSERHKISHSPRLPVMPCIVPVMDSHVRLVPHFRSIHFQCGFITSYACSNINKIKLFSYSFIIAAWRNASASVCSCVD